MVVDVLTPLFEFTETDVPPVTAGGVGGPSAPQDAISPQKASAANNRVIPKPLSNVQFAHAPVPAQCRHSLFEMPPSFQRLILYKHLR